MSYMKYWSSEWLVVYGAQRVLIAQVININTVMARADAYMQRDESDLVYNRASVCWSL